MDPSMGCHARSRKTAHASTVTKVPTKTKKNEQNHGAPRARRIAPQPRASIERRLANLKVDLLTRSPRQWRRLTCKSELAREANRQRCRRGAAEELITDIGPPGEAMEELNSPY
ncbi:hypothetical protein THAOC_29968, partial [Thalassiosira oceanica]